MAGRSAPAGDESKLQLSAHVHRWIRASPSTTLGKEARRDNYKVMMEKRNMIGSSEEQCLWR